MMAQMARALWNNSAGEKQGAGIERIERWEVMLSKKGGGMMLMKCSPEVQEKGPEM